MNLNLITRINRCGRQNSQCASQSNSAVKWTIVRTMIMGQFNCVMHVPASEALASYISILYVLELTEVSKASEKSHVIDDVLK